MKLDRLAQEIGAQVVAKPRTGVAGIEQVYAGDRVSDLLNHATSATLLVSNLGGGQLVRLAQLMGVPGLCLVNGMVPDPAVVEWAREHHTLLMVSPAAMFETCGRLYEALRKERSAP